MSNTHNDTNFSPVSGSSRQMGIVKWFNNKAGFGFVTTLGDENKDVFVHHSGVSVNKEQYKYLVQGEYVEFDLSKSENSEHKWQATNITGLQSGPLMCETRFLNKQERSDGDQRGDQPVRRSGPRDGRSGPRDSQRDSRRNTKGGSAQSTERTNGGDNKWELDESS